MTYELDAATNSVPTGPGTRSVELTSDWNTPAGTANGGYLLAILLRAALEESDKPDPLSVAVTYLKPTKPGPADLTVSPVRLGRRVSTYTVTLSQAGSLITHAVVSLHDAELAGDQQHDGDVAPSIPLPADGIDPMAEWPPGTIPIADRYTARHAAVPPWMTGTPSGDPEAAFWIRPADQRPIDAFAAGAIVDAYPPVTTEVGEIGSATIQLTVHFWRRFTSEWVLMEVVTRRIVDGFHDEDVRLWDTEGRLVATSRQLALLS
ncbi:thioesterase family protein [Aeromicrobium sp. Leaf350]|uniref:thioesterase family protein n=1 Tax=Aeromicrobium sp. Leaf350 TaxID=2876565 RepID=UPI001E3A1E5C|nr:thioesterase family protein [Aeromicrobium sp. Leaf350]